MNAWLAELGPVDALPLFAVLFAVSFFFSGTETALFSLQKVDLQRFAGDGRSGRRVVRLLQRRTALISSILIGNETVNVAISTLGAILVANLLPGRPWVNVVVLAPALLLFSEITPKVTAFRYSAAWSALAAWPLSFFVVLVTPLRWVVAGLVTLLARPFGVQGDRAEDRLAEAQILTLIEQGAARGDVDEREREIIEAVFEFDDLTVARVMTPRPDIFAIPIDLPWKDLLAQCREGDLSRIPVYEGRTDNIVGVLLLKDLLKYRSRPPAGPRQLRSMLLPPTFVPKSKQADTMLREFLERRYHLAFVVNEHGTLVGLVTLDDLLSELVGELLDSPEDDNGPEILRIDDETLEVKAHVDLEDFAKETEITLPEGDYQTLGGFVFHLLGRLPREGDAVHWEGHRFEVAGMEERRITQVRVTASPADDAPDQAEERP